MLHPLSMFLPSAVLFALAMVPVPTVRYRRVGGLRFLRVARLQVSFCVVRREGV